MDKIVVKVLCYLQVAKSIVLIIIGPIRVIKVLRPVCWVIN